MKTIIIKAISLAAAVVMVISSTAMARASKSKIVKNTAEDNIDMSEYLLYQDFTDIAQGSLPEGWRANNANGSFSTEITDNGKKKKNCLTLTDTNPNNSGPRMRIPFSGGDKGFILMETRFKFEQTGTSGYTVMTIQANSPDKKAMDGYYPSGNAKFVVRDIDAAAPITVMKSEMVLGNWYVLRYCFDLENGTFDVSMTDDTTGETGTVFGLNSAKNISDFDIYSENYDGKWYFDYFNIKKVKSGLTKVKNSNIKKGVEAEIIEGPSNHAVKNTVNVKLDGRYKYLLDRAIVKDGEVFVSARSFAYMLSVGYVPDDGKCTVGAENKRMTFADNSDTAVSDGGSVGLSASCCVLNGIIYIPFKDAAEEFGYTYEFSGDANEVVLTKTTSAE